MSPAAMVHALELVCEAETVLRSDTLTPAERGRALGCLTCVRAALESSIEVAAESGPVSRVLRRVCA